MQNSPAYDLDWNLVRTFVAVAKGGSLAAGARHLGITHPTAARHIQLLEEGLGTNLFTRGGKGLVLNDMGHALQDSAAQMHDSAVAFQGHIDQLREAPITQVRIAVSNLIAEVVPSLVAEQVASHDGTRVDLVVTHDVLNLLQREADIAIRHVRPHQQELICKRIGALPMGVYAHPNYCEKYGPLRSNNVAEHRFIEGLGRDHLTEGAAREGIEILPEQISFRTDSVACQRAAVESAWGMAVFPRWMAESHWISMFENAVMDVEVWLVARPEVRDNQPLKKLFRALGEALEQHVLQAQPR